MTSIGYGQEAERYQFVQGTYMAGDIKVDDYSTLASGRIHEDYVILRNSGVANNGTARFEFSELSENAMFSVEFIVNVATFEYTYDRGNIYKINNGQPELIYSNDPTENEVATFSISFAKADSTDLDGIDYVTVGFNGSALDQVQLYAYEGNVFIESKITPLGGDPFMGTYVLTEKYYHPMTEVNFAQREIYVNEGDLADVVLDLTVANNTNEDIQANIALTSSDAPHLSGFSAASVTFEQTDVNASFGLQTLADQMSAGTYVLKITDVSGPSVIKGPGDILVVHVIKGPEPVDVMPALPGELRIVAYDNDVGAGMDKLTVTNLVELQPGATFQVVNATYTSNAQVWLGRDIADNPVAAQRLTYTGTSPLPINSLICFDLPASGNVPLDNISLNGAPTNVFSVSRAGASSNPLLEIPTDAAGALFLVSGDWVHSAGSKLIGRVLDGIMIGGYWQTDSDIPEDIDCSALQGPFQPGSYFGFYDCRYIQDQGLEAGALSLDIADYNAWVTDIGTDIDNFEDIGVDVCSPDCLYCCEEYAYEISCCRIQISSTCRNDQTIQWEVSTLGSDNWSELVGVTGHTLSASTVGDPSYFTSHEWAFRAVFTDEDDRCQSYATQAFSFGIQAEIVKTDCNLSAVINNAGEAVCDANVSGYVWSFSRTGEDFITIAETSSEISAFANGTYKLRIDFSTGCSRDATYDVFNCTDCDQFSINNFEIDQSEVCLGEAITVSISAHSNLLQDELYYRWPPEFGVSDLITQEAVSPVITESTSYIVTVTNNYDCVLEQSIDIEAKEQPLLSFNPSTIIICGDQEVSIDPVISDCTGCTYLWSDGSTDRIFTGAISSDQYVALTITNQAGCGSQQSVYVNHKTLLPVELIAGGSSICGDELTIMADYNLPAGTPRYRWLKVVDGTSTEISEGWGEPHRTLTTLSDPDVEKYILELSIYNEDASEVSLAYCAEDTEYVPNVTLPVISIQSEIEELCAGTTEPVTLTGTPPPSDNWTITWSKNGAPISGEVQHTLNTSIAPGDTYACHIKENTFQSCEVSTDINIGTLSVPELTFTGDDNYCTDGEANIVAVVTGGTAPYTYLWQDNTTNASILSQIDNNGTETISQEYSLTVTDANGCTVFGSTTLEVYPKPELTITPDNISICDDDIIEVTVEMNQCDDCVISWDEEEGVAWVGPVMTFSKLVSGDDIINVQVTTGDACVVSDQVTIDHKEQLSSLIHPVPPTICGATIELQAQVDVPEGHTASYSWATLIGSTTTYIATNQESASLYTQGATDVDAYVLSVELYNSNGEVSTEYCIEGSSRTVNLVQPEVQITPQDISVCASDTKNITLTGSTPPDGGNWIITWKKNNIIIAGADQSTLETEAAPEDTYTYHIIEDTYQTCEASTTLTIGAHALPTLSFSGDVNYCSGSSATIQAVVSGGQAPYTYQWQDNSTASSILSNLNTDGPDNLNQVYAVTVTDANGCTVEGSTSITISPQPVVTLSESVLSICDDQEISVMVSVDNCNGCNISWGNNTAIPFVGPTMTFDKQVESDETISVTVTTEQCSVTESVYVDHKELLTSSITVPNQIICGESFILQANITVPTGHTATYFWEKVVNGTSISLGADPSASTLPTIGDANVDAYILSVVLYGSDGDISTSYCVEDFTKSITVQQPTVAISPIDFIVCEGSTDDITLEGTAPPPGDGWSISWSYDGQVITTATTSILSNYTVEPGKEITYSISHEDLMCAASTTITTPSAPAPTVALSGTTTYCKGESISITATPSGGTGPFTYIWTKDEGVVGTDANTYNDVAETSDSENTVDQLKVTIIDANGCTASTNTTITINSIPQVTLDQNTSDCGGISATITPHNTRTNVEISIDGEEGTFENFLDTDGTVAIEADANQTYDVWVRWDDGDCARKLEDFAVNGEGCLEVGLTGPTSPCAGTHTLTASTTGGTANYYYVWTVNGEEVQSTPSGGSTSATDTYSFYMESNTSYDYSVAVTDAITVEPKTDNASTYVRETPLFNLTGPATVCGDQNSVRYSISNLTGCEGICFYSWSDEGRVGSGTGDKANYNITEDLEISVTVTNYNGCFTTQSIDVNKLQKVSPSISVSPSSVSCGGSVTVSTNYTPPSGLSIVSYNWSWGNTGSYGQSSSVSVEVTEQTYVSLSIELSGGDYCVEGSKIINHSGSVSINSDGQFCSASPITLTASTQGISGTKIYKWYDENTPGGPLATGDSYMITPVDGASYRVDVDSDNGCSASDYIDIQVVSDECNANLSNTPCCCEGDIIDDYSIPPGCDTETLSYSVRNSTTDEENIINADIEISVMIEADPGCDISVIDWTLSLNVGARDNVQIVDVSSDCWGCVTLTGIAQFSGRCSNNTIYAIKSELTYRDCDAVKEQELIAQNVRFCTTN